MTNPVTEFVAENAHVSEIHEYVDDHGEPCTGEVERTTIDGHPVTVSKSLTDDERERVAEGVRALEPGVKVCYANSFHLWEHDDQFSYVEGFATAEEIGGLCIEHAWNELNGKLVDLTAEFDYYHGVSFSDEEPLAKYHEIGKEEGVWGILGNHKNKFEFLRDEGYL